jgi:hypothetical protein
VVSGLHTWLLEDATPVLTNNVIHTTQHPIHYNKGKFYLSVTVNRVIHHWNRLPVTAEGETPGTDETYFLNTVTKPGNLEICPFPLHTPTVSHSTRLRPSAATHDVVDSTRYSSNHLQQGRATKMKSERMQYSATNMASSEIGVGVFFP